MVPPLRVCFFLRACYYVSYRISEALVDPFEISYGCNLLIFHFMISIVLLPSLLACNFLYFDIMQANSPLRTLDELHICEMPAWPCFPSPEDREFSPPMAEVKDSDKSSSESMNLKQGTPEKLRCFVVTARARSFLYHQVMVLETCSCLASFESCD